MAHCQAPRLQLLPSIFCPVMQGSSKAREGQGKGCPEACGLFPAPKNLPLLQTKITPLHWHVGKFPFPSRKPASHLFLVNIPDQATSGQLRAETKFRGVMAPPPPQYSEFIRTSAEFHHLHAPHVAGPLELDFISTMGPGNSWRRKGSLLAFLREDLMGMN